MARRIDDGVIDLQGTIMEPNFRYDQLVAVYEGAWADDPQAGRIVELLVLGFNGYRAYRDVHSPSLHDRWAYRVELAEGVGDTICVAEELVALAEYGGGGGR